MTGTGSRVARSPFCRTAEITMGNQAIVLLRLVDLDRLTLDVIFVFAAAYPGPWDAVMRKFTHSNRRFLGENSRNFLVSTPVRTTHRIQKMNMRPIAFCLDAIAKRRLHATLRRTTVASPRWHERQDHRFLARSGGFYRTAFASEATANHQHVGTY